MTRPLRFGICTDQNLSWPRLVERWQLFEVLGFDSVWVCDHYIQPSQPTGPYFEGWTALAGLAARTERIRLGVLVSCNTFRHPALLAKEAVTVDHISNGRLELGLGAGWYRPEHERFGIEMPDPPELIEQFREAVEIVDALLRHGSSTYHGRYYQLEDAPLKPAPLQRPRPPLTLGAHRSRMLAIAARYADTWNSFGTVEELRERNQTLNEHCARIGRDPSEINRSLYGWASMLPSDPWESVDTFEDVVRRYRAVGINEFIIDQPRDDQLDVLELVARTLIPNLRAGQP